MSRIFTTTLRLNLDHPEDRRAYEYLRNRDRKQYRSYSSAIVAAVNGSFSRQERLAEDPFLETRERQEAFLQEVKEAVRDSIREQQAGMGGLAALLQAAQASPPVPAKSEISDENFDAAMDFMRSL